MFTAEQIEKMGLVAWESLEGFSEARYIVEHLADHDEECL